MQDHHIGDEMVVLDNLALLVAQVLSDLPFSAEEQLLGEAIELF